MTLVYFGFRDEGGPRTDEDRAVIRLRRLVAAGCIAFAAYAVAGGVL
jgi:hypothetical protein